MIYSTYKNINYGNILSGLSPPIIDPYDSDEYNEYDD